MLSVVFTQSRQPLMISLRSGTQPAVPQVASYDISRALAGGSEAISRYSRYYELLYPSER